MSISPEIPNSAAPRILIVDDEESVMVTLRETLRFEKYEVVATCSPSAALEELQKGWFAVILSDQRMPEMTGLELFARAREMQPDATRILITAVLSLETVVDAINKGEIYRFIIKPWLREELLVTVRNGVRRYELIRQNRQLQSATEEVNGKLVDLNRRLEQQVKVVALQNQQLAGMNQALEQNLARSIELCVQVMQTYYPVLGNQARRVAQICNSMTQVLGLSADDARVLNTAALLHDIGLVGVPRNLIRQWQENSATLSTAERALIEQHPILSQEMAAFGSGMDQVGTVIRAHHERVDGKGYPDGLVGENIPWLSRLLAAAVAFAASPRGHDDALNEVRMQSNSAFDAEAVRTLAKALALAPVPRRERQIQLSDLQPGMVIARGIYNTKGILLVPEGRELNATFIEKLLNHHRIQPITQSLVVYC